MAINWKLLMWLNYPPLSTEPTIRPIFGRCGLCPESTILSWLHLWLTDGLLHARSSVNKVVLSRIPQRSEVLGPILFSFHTADLRTAIDRRGLIPHVVIRRSLVYSRDSQSPWQQPPVGWTRRGLRSCSLGMIRFRRRIPGSANIGIRPLHRDVSGSACPFVQ